MPASIKISNFVIILLIILFLSPMQQNVAYFFSSLFFLMHENVILKQIKMKHIISQ